MDNDFIAFLEVGHALPHAGHLPGELVADLSAAGLLEMNDTCIGTDDDNGIREQKGQSEQLFRIEAACREKPR